jgi:hypothetical protein
VVLNAPDYNGVSPLLSAVSLVAVYPGGQRSSSQKAAKNGPDTAASGVHSADVEEEEEEEEGEPTSNPATVRGEACRAMAS